MTSAPHLPPVENPTDPQAQAAFERSIRLYGMVSTVAKVIYARQPQLATLAQHIVEVRESLSLGPELRLLIEMKASQLNGCAFCQDLTLALALREDIGAERFDGLDDFANSDAFSPREKAALAFVEEATQHRKVGEAAWEEVRKYFNEAEIVELAWLNAAENYFNLQAGVLGIESDGLSQKIRENP